MDSFLKYYESPETRPVFETVDEMLKWAGLYNLTTRTLQDELIDTKLSPLLIEELVTVRILNYDTKLSPFNIHSTICLRLLPFYESLDISV